MKHLGNLGTDTPLLPNASLIKHQSPQKASCTHMAGPAHKHKVFGDNCSMSRANHSELASNWELMQHMSAARTPVMHVEHSSRRIFWMSCSFSTQLLPIQRIEEESLYFEIAYQLLIHPLTFSLGTIHPYKTCCLLTKSFLSSDFIAGKFLSYTKPGHAQQIGSDLLQAAQKKHRTLHYQMFPSLSPYILKAK